MDILTLILALTGMGILLYGMHLFSLALEPMMSSNVGRRFGQLANNPFGGYLFSGGLTFFSQKGTLNCRMLMGLVDVGAITQRQALPYVLGSSLGAGLCMVLMMFQGINVTVYLTLFCLFGAIVNMCLKGEISQIVAKAFVGFGMLFLGVHLVGAGAKEIFSEKIVFDFLSANVTPFLIIILGFLLGLITTSSFASVTILASLSMVGGPVSFELACLGMIAVGAGTALADFIYTTTGHSLASKRVMTFFVATRFIGAIIFSLLYFSGFFTWLFNFCGQNSVFGLSLIYLLELVVISAIFVPVAPYFSNIFNKIMPFKARKSDIGEFALVDLDVDVYAVGFPAVLKSTNKLMNMISSTQGKMLDRIENKQEDGSLGEIKKIDKALRVTENIVLRLSRTVNHNDLSRLNILRNVLSDVEYLNQRTLKLYDLGTDIIRTNKVITEDELKNIRVLFEELNKQYVMVANMLETLMNNERVRNSQLKLMMIANKQLFAMCQKMKTEYLNNFRNNGSFPVGNDENFTMLLIVEDINTALTNISVKLGILSN